VAPPSAAPAQDEATVARGRVLVAEDNTVNQLVIVGMLAKRGIEADVVGDGAAAVDGVRHGEHAAVFMDCQMPVLDGYAATARIRERERDGQRIPVIAMTAHAMAGDRERCLQAGMDDYVAKPVRPEDLDAVLDRWLGEAPAAEPADLAGPHANGDGAQLVDEGRIRSFVQDFPGMAEQLLDVFAETTPPLVQALRDAAQRGDDTAVGRTAHELKGSCRNMGAVAMADVCVAIERGDTGGAEAADALGDVLPRTLERLRRAIDG